MSKYCPVDIFGKENCIGEINDSKRNYTDHSVQFCCDRHRKHSGRISHDKAEWAVLIEKDLEDGDVQEGYIEWALTQEETLAMSPCSDVYIQCRYRLADDSAYATKIYTERPYNVEKDGVI